MTAAEQFQRHAKCATFGSKAGFIAQNIPQRCGLSVGHNCVMEAHVRLLMGHLQAWPLHWRDGDGHKTFAGHLQMVAPNVVFTVAALARDVEDAVELCA